MKSLNAFSNVNCFLFHYFHIISSKIFCLEIKIMEETNTFRNKLYYEV